MTLLDVYEAKWLLRNWAELKRSDLEVIVGQISDSNSGTKPVKTPNQCNNEIEAMKKKMYQMESAVNNHFVLASWCSQNCGAKCNFFIPWESSV